MAPFGQDPHGVGEVALFVERGDPGGPHGTVVVGSRGESVLAAEYVVQAEANLLFIVHALRAAGRFAGALDGGKEQGDQDRDDRDHDEQLDQGEATALCHFEPREKKQKNYFLALMSNVKLFDPEPIVAVIGVF